MFVDMHELAIGDDLDAIRDGAAADPDSLNRRDENGLPALYMAALYSNRPAIELLLELGADVDLFAAAYLGESEQAEKLLRSQSELARETTADGMTPLHYAARAGHSSVVNVLLAHGADPNVTDAKGRSPLNEACHGGPWKPAADQAVIDLLLEAGANVDLHAAAGMGRVDLVEQHLEAAPQRLDSLNGREQTPLCVAAHNNQLAVVKLLVERGADLDRADAVGMAALHTLSQQCDDELVQYLIDAGADSHLCTHVACGDVEGARRKLQQNPESLSEEYYGFTALDYAIHSWQPEALRLLLRSGAKLNEEDQQHILRITHDNQAFLDDLLALE